MVTRRDLTPGQQAAQLCHAITRFTLDHPLIASDWHTVSNRIVCLAAKDESELHTLLARAREEGIAVSAFEEPMFNNKITAIVLSPVPASERLCAQLPLALKMVVPLDSMRKVTNTIRTVEVPISPFAYFSNKIKAWFAPEVQS